MTEATDSDRPRDPERHAAHWPAVAETEVPDLLSGGRPVAPEPERPPGRRSPPVPEPPPEAHRGRRRRREPRGHAVPGTLALGGHDRAAAQPPVMDLGGRAAAE